MKLIVIKKLKIIFAPIFCIVLVNYVNFWIIPLVFSLIVVILNLKAFKFNITTKFIISSYLSFLISILFYSIIGYALGLLPESTFPIGKWRIVDVSFLISLGVISPILFFYFNSFIISSLNFKRNSNIILLCSLIISIGAFLIYLYELKAEYSFALWQLVIIITLQFMLNQKVIT